jgi:flagellar protein FlaG
MDMEVHRATILTQLSRNLPGDTRQAREAPQPEPTQESRKAEPKMTPEQYLSDILNMTSAFNKRLKFYINREIDQVVVKVVDRETDKVIKEIPPAELQRLHARIKETLGILFDQTI